MTVQTIKRTVSLTKSLAQLLLVAQHRQQVGDAWVAALPLERRRNLGAMVGLM